MTNIWDQRFAAEDYMYGTEPNLFLADQVRTHLAPGQSVLAVADGEGRNGVWMASRGLGVTSVDGSARGIEKTRALAAARGVDIETIQADLLNWQWPVAAFDAAAVIFLHFHPAERRTVHADIQRAVKPGGLIIMEVFHPRQLDYGTGGPPVSDMLYTADMLRADFADAEFLLLEDEKMVGLNEGALHAGTAMVTRMVARRPA